MTEEGSDDPAAKAMYTFVDFIGEVVQFTASAFGGIKVANRLHNWGRDLGINKQPERNTSDQHQMLQGLVLIASWGAFEAFFEDFCRAVLARDQHISDAHEAYRKLVEDTRRRKAAIRFEKALSGIDRDGAIPDKLLKALKDANQIRNVWAHNRGAANEVFMMTAPDLGYTVGERVIMTTEQYTRYVFAQGSYATIITARDMMTTGRSVPPVSIMDKNPSQDEYAALFGV